ncbi:hypothetical protein [Aureimonas psammosilenae]|uniref:hypothetical protein n=1 Tax=Aureimonas psammosilenae TaxID=2495496 RepID=UPI001260C375|nr:hypothetical protein [Aureimonas psammosilenae]
MNGSTNARDLAERHFRALQTGTAQPVVFGLASAAETKASADKTARLKALRLERDSAVRPEARKAIRSQTGNHISRR